MLRRRGSRNDSRLRRLTLWTPMLCFASWNLGGNIKGIKTMQNLALYVITVLIWGSTWIAVKFQLTDPALLSVAYRYGFAALVMLAFCAVTGRLFKIRWTPKQYMFVAIQGFFLFFLNYWLFYITSQYLTSGLVAVCLSTIIIMNIFNQALFFRIRVKPQIALATLFGLAGIISVFWHEVQALSFHDDNFKGILIGLAATYTASIGNILSARNSRDGIPVLETNTIGMLVGALSAFLFATFYKIPLQFDFSASYIISLTYLAVFGTVIAFGTYLTLIARIGADRAAYAAVLFPVVALAISTIFENYRWTWEAFAGIGLILIGNALALMKSSHLKHLLRLVLLKQNPAEDSGGQDGQGINEHIR